MALAASLGDSTAHVGCEVRFWRCADESVEAGAVAADIERLVFREGVEPGRIAVIAPSLGPESRAIATALQERAIPHRVLGPGAVLSRPEVRDVLAWMRLLLHPDDAGATSRALLAPPIELRHVDLAQVIQIARRRRLDIVSALAPSIESPQVAPQAQDRLRRFLALHGDLGAALDDLSPQRFTSLLLERMGLSRGRPLTGQVERADLAASVSWLQETAGAFERRFPWAGARELAAHLLGVADEGKPEGMPDGQRGGLGTGGEQTVAVELKGLGMPCAAGVAHAYLIGLHARALDDAERLLEQEAIGEVLGSVSDSVVVSYACNADGAHGCEPASAIEQLRAAFGGEWEERSHERADPEEMIEAALRAMRQELLDGVSSIGARLGELRLDTDIDVSHGVVRYLELVKLAALLERPKGQSVAEALADVNARLLAAVTPLQREILESSTLDEELLAGRASGYQAGSAVARAAAGEPSLLRFLPRREGGLLLSASDIDLYRTCPLRYKFARVLRVPTEPTRNQRFGIAMHQVLERYHASGGRTAAELLELLDQCWRRGGFGDGPEDRQLRAKATTALRRYHERLSEQASEPVWFERSFAFRIGSHHVRGRVDRIDRLPGGGYEVIDYKTGRPKREEQLREDVQLSLYALAASESWQLEGCKLTYYHLLDDVKVPLPAGAADIEWVRGVAIEAGEAILQERFEPTPSALTCAACDYRVLCPVAEG